MIGAEVTGTEVKQEATPDATNTGCVPGGVYLCQVGETVSCGACCGLYNVADASFDNLNRMLATRTAMFADVPREIAAIVDFGQHILDHQVGCKPLTEFHHCPYIGLVGKHKSRVGCLLHPRADGNHGIDLRGLSDYGGMACRDYFCPSYTGLSHEIKGILREGARGWYEYGRLVTEAELLNELFQQALGNCHKPIQKGQVPTAVRSRKIFGILSRLKTRWPYVAKSEPLQCHYFFRDGLYHRSQVIYPAAVGPSRYHNIFRELCARFATKTELRQAEDLLANVIQDLAAAAAGA